MARSGLNPATPGLAAPVTGPFQLWSGLRRWNLPLHQITGHLYLAGVALAGCAAFFLAAYAEPHDFGVTLAGLAMAWWLCVGMAFVAIRRRRIEAHRQWMIRGYVLTLTFVTFRYLVDLPLWAPLCGAPCHGGLAQLGHAAAHRRSGAAVAALSGRCASATRERRLTSV